MAFKDGELLVLSLLRDISEKYIEQKELLKELHDDPGCMSHMRERIAEVLENKVI